MNLLQINDPERLAKTSLSRKLTLGGVTKAYPVYRVSLDLLFYNDQNDRIATWITQYKNDSSKEDFANLSRDEYNGIIEKFIIDSNSAAIEKTKNNIALVNQREPGVVLSDGRIIDGNRRFTCLRLLNREDPSVRYFETVILDDLSENGKKQVKMLELAIQHGEEQRVDYNQIDMAIGAYHDITETQLLTIEEYAASTNETINDVKKRLEVAQLIIEFLEFMKLPGQYHIAREMQVYSLFFECIPLLKRCETVESKEDLKNCVFNNAMMGAHTDQKKFIRSLRSMMESGLYSSYIKRQQKISEAVNEKKKEAVIRDKKELDAFIAANEDIAEDMQVALDRSLVQAKKAQTKSRPSQLVSKSISTLLDIDTGIIDKLSDAEKGQLHSQLEKLSDAVTMIRQDVTDEIPETEKAPALPARKGYVLSVAKKREPLFFCTTEKTTITNLGFSLDFSAYGYLPGQPDRVKRYVFFTDSEYEELCPVQEVCAICGETTRVSFSLNTRASALNECYLIIKSEIDGYNEAKEILKFDIKISFGVDFDF